MPLARAAGLFVLCLGVACTAARPEPLRGAESVGVASVAVEPGTVSPQGPARFDYPETPRGDVVDQIHGVAVPDPYRWLEGDGPDVTAWFEAEDARARREIAKLDGVEGRWQEMASLWRGIHEPREIRRGGRTFYRDREGVWMKAGEAPRVLLFDPKTLEGTQRLTHFTVSTDGRWMALELSVGGADMRTLRVMETGARAITEELTGIEDTRVVWRGAGFFYAFTPTDVAHATRWSERSIRFHAARTPQTSDREVVPPSRDPDATSAMRPLSVTRDGARLVVQTFGNDERDAFAVVDTATPAWSVHPLDAPKGKVSEACAVGNSVFVAVRLDDGSADIAGIGDPGKRWTTLLHADKTLLSMRALGSHVLLEYARGASVRFEILDDRLRRLAVRETVPGTTESLSADIGAREVTIEHEGLRSPPERLLFDPQTGQTTTIAKVSVPFDPEAFVVDSLSAASKDGTRIPITLLRPKTFEKDGGAPLWMYAYGGFSVSAEQVFYPPWVSWAMHHGVFAICHARGGLENGLAWHTAGARRNRERTVEDVAACLEEVQRQGYSQPSRTMLQGWSHGGMLVSAVATQHPELEKVVLATVPLADMIRFPLFGRGGVSEYGDPEDADDFKSLLSFSPYHHVKEGTAYPAFFITASSNDERVAPMHPRKLAAALQHASTGGEVLLKVNWGAGHHGGGKEDANRAFAEASVFAMRAFGLVDRAP